MVECRHPHFWIANCAVYCTPPHTALENATPALLGGPPPHHTCHFNSQLQWLKGVGGSSSTLHMSLQLSTAMADGGWVGPPPHYTCHFNCQLPMANGGGWYPPNFTSSQSHIVLGWGGGYPPHLTNHVVCTSAVKPN